jgi:hypothetical protein
MYFAAADGGAMGAIAEMAFGGFAVKLENGTISPSVLWYMSFMDSQDINIMLNIKGCAFVLTDYSSSGGLDIRDPEILKGMMFQLNSTKEIVEITEEQFYDLNA